MQTKNGWARPIETPQTKTGHQKSLVSFRKGLPWYSFCTQSFTGSSSRKPDLCTQQLESQKLVMLTVVGIWRVCSHRCHIKGKEMLCDMILSTISTQLVLMFDLEEHLRHKQHEILHILYCSEI